MMPMTGVPLPFISYGGSFTLCLMVSIAFVQRVCIETRIRTIPVTTPNSSTITAKIKSV